MATTASWLSREQAAQADFIRHVAELKAFAGDADKTSFGEAIDAFASVTRRFGTCELSIRRGERLGVVGTSRAESKALLEHGRHANEGGLAALGSVQAFVDDLAATPVDDTAQGRWKAESSTVRAEWKEQLAQVDIGASDARHLVRITDACFSSLDEAGPAGLSRYLAEQLAELEKVRRTPERGTWANSFPWWKIVAAAIWLGITAYAVWRAITYGAAWWDVAMIIFIALIGTILIALGC